MKIDQVRVCKCPQPTYRWDHDLCSECEAHIVVVDWEDADDEWTESIKSAHPTRAGTYDEYAMAMRMVGHRHSKGELVALVTWLLTKNKPHADAVTRAERAERVLAQIETWAGRRPILGVPLSHGQRDSQPKPEKT